MSAPSSINQHLKRMARDSAIYLPSMVIPGIIGILLIRVLTTLFSHEQYGYYNLALSTIGLIKAFSVVWLSNSAIRFYQQYGKKKAGHFFTTTLLAATIFSAVFCALAAYLLVSIVFRNHIAEGFASVLNVTILSSVFVTVFEVFVMIFRAKLEPSKYSLFWLIYVVGKPLLGIFFIVRFGMGAEGIFWGFVIVPLILNIFMLMEQGVLSGLRSKFCSSKIIRRFLSYGMPLALSNLAFWVLSLSDRYLIEYFRGSSEVGLYGLGYAIPEKTLQFSFMTLMLAAFPIIIQNWESNNRGETQKLITEMSRYYVLLITPLLVALVVLPQDILLLFSDKQFIEGATVIPIIAGGLYIYGLAQYVQKGLELTKNSKMIAMTALVSGSLNIVMNFFLIPRLGSKGAALSCLAAYASYFICSFFFVRGSLPWKAPVATIAKTIAAAAAMVLMIKLVHSAATIFMIQLFLSLTVGLVAYAVIIFLTGEIRPSEIQSVLRFFKRR